MRKPAATYSRVLAGYTVTWRFAVTRRIAVTGGSTVIRGSLVVTGDAVTPRYAVGLCDAVTSCDAITSCDAGNALRDTAVMAGGTVRGMCGGGGWPSGGCCEAA